MFKFFRNIRQKFLSENKVSKYVAYAIGEIVLVVIGIFIAIQLNDWNQQRLEQKALHVTLQNLQDEFGRTRGLLHTISSYYQTSLDANLELLQLFYQNPDEIAASRVDSLLAKGSNQAPFYPPQPVLEELLASGKIKSLSNETLKVYLLEWKATMHWFHFDYDLMIGFNSNEFIPYINKHWPWKNIDLAYTEEYNRKRSTFTPRPEELFRDLEFENLIENSKFHTNRLFRRLKSMDTLIGNIQEEINGNLLQNNKASKR